jgi:glycosyltransferase involved in cell wall biosynthesis
MPVTLPDLQVYKTLFIKKGITYPLKPIPATKGLLNELPAYQQNKSGWPWNAETDVELYKKLPTWPKLTIVTPSYNQGHFIEETIRSVLLQNYPNLEYIIVDGGSTDDTKDIIEKYSPWISYWQSEKDGGQSNAINQGFSLASGEYLAWINSDDYYLKEVFFNVISTFTKKNADFVYGYGLNFYTKENKFKLVQFPPLLDYFIRFPSLVQPSCFWRSAIHQPLCEDLHCSLDYELWLRMIKGVRKAFIKEALSVANVHDHAKTSDPKMDIIWRHDHELICSPDAHGPVNDWGKKSLLLRVYTLLYKIFEKSPSY